MLNFLYILLILTPPQVRPGWPIYVQSSSWIEFYGGLKAFDFDGDRNKEIFVVTGNSLFFSLHGFRINGENIFGYPIVYQQPNLTSQQSVGIGNILANNSPYIIFGNKPISGFSQANVYSNDIGGESASGFPYLLPYGIGVRYPVTLSDLDHNGDAEILVHSHQLILNGDGSIYPNWEPLNNPIYTRMIAGDLNNDGVPEIIGLFMQDSLPALGVWDLDTHSFLPGFPVVFNLNNIIYGLTPVIADFDQDDTFEILLPTNLAPGTSDTAFFHVFKYDGTELYGFPIKIPDEDFHAPPAIADIDHDGQLEAIIDGIFDFVIIKRDGSYLQIPDDGLLIGGEPAIADVDGDGQLEVVIGRHFTQDSLSVWHAYRLDGSEPDGWPVSVYGTTIGTPLIDDLDNDGLLEMAVLSLGNPVMMQDTMIIYVFDLPAPFDSAMVPWGQYAHDLWNSGIYGFNPPVSVAERGPTSVLPPAYSVEYAHGRPILTLTLSHPQKISLSLYDLAGRLLWARSLSLSRGTIVLPLDQPSSRGVYFLRVNHRVLKLWIP